MKKFGTPIAAGPGSENEKVGLDGVGTPPGPMYAGGFGGAGGFTLPLGLTVDGAVVGPLCELGWLVPGPLVCGGVVEGEVVVEGWVWVVVEPEPECVEDGVDGVVDEVLVELVLVEVGVLVVDVVVVSGVVGVVTVGVVLGAWGQDSETDRTGTERFSDEIGVPGGSWK